MKTLPLSRGLVAMVDDEDFEMLNQWKWTAMTSPGDNTFYANRHIKIDGKWKQQRMHRLIMGATGKQKVDHKDGNGLNNQKSNLRICTHSQNLMNMRIHNKHGFKGVSYIPANIYHPWRAMIRPMGKRIFLGHYATSIEAAAAYNQKAVELFGEFARLNPL